jgi:hypothetical protein
MEIAILEAALTLVNWDNTVALSAFGAATAFSSMALAPANYRWPPPPNARRSE